MSTKPGATIRPAASISRRAGAEPGADGGDPAVLHGDIGDAARGAGAVDNGSVSDDEVKHGAKDRPGRPGRSMFAARTSHPRPGRPTFAETASLHAARRMRGVTAPNRCVVSPMVQYRATDGLVNDYHLVHLGKFALGKFGIVFTENCAVEPRGRVTQGDLGLWDDGQIEGHKRLRALPQAGGRAGRAPRSPIPAARASTPRSFDKPGQLGPAGAGWQKWEVVGPSELSAAEGWLMPRRSTATRSRTWCRSSARPRGAPMPRATTSSRSTARTATCWRSSCRRSATRATISMAATAPAACAFRSMSARAVRAGWPEQQADVHPRLDGRRRAAAGTSRTRWSSPRR